MSNLTDENFKGDFFGRLLDTGQSERIIGQMISASNGPIDICSAYLRSEALDHLLIGWKKVLGCRILVRWQLCDLVFGASDFRAFEVAESHGIEFYMRLNFHGKLYYLPPGGIVVGSANATLSGLGIAEKPNSEVCTLVDDRAENRNLVQGLYSGATKVNRKLFQKLVNTAASIKSEPAAYASKDWPLQILEELSETNHSLRRIFVDECLLSKPEWFEKKIASLSREAFHDLELLGFPKGIPVGLNQEIMLQHGLRNTAQFQWLINSLRADISGLFFGQLTMSLHRIILDDPAPRRYTVKGLLQNLLEWVTALRIEEIVIDRPNFSQRIRLVGPSTPPVSCKT